jgi:hypothetical protein
MFRGAIATQYLPSEAEVVNLTIRLRLSHVADRKDPYALREVGNERDARAVAATAWFACQKLEALQRKWQDLFKATARAAS